MSPSFFAENAFKMGIPLSAAQLEAFEIYAGELVKWNQRVNLTSIVSHDEIVVRHFLDSLSTLLVLRRDQPKTLIDIGSGAGFPGLALKIALPDLDVKLLEATGKKVAFLDHMIGTLKLQNVSALHARAEELAHRPEHREKFDAAVARAVAELPTLLEYALPFLRIGGVFIAQKGIEIDSEIASATRALAILGGRVREIVPVNLPGLEPRHLIVIEKTTTSPAAYPRRPGVPDKKPLR